MFGRSACMRLNLRQLCAAILAVAVSGAAQAQQKLFPPAEGEIRALVIGIDHYKTAKNLKGAVADARDLERSLRNAGIRDLTVLVEDSASRNQVVSAMNRLITESKAGDLIFVSFAGHGAQLPERNKGSDPDGVDEVFVLSAFESRGAGTAERILDKEINVWLRRLEQKGVQTMFVADTCHGGGLTKAVDMRAGELSYRQTPITIAPLEDALRPISTTADPKMSPADFDRLTFLAAADKWTKVPEVQIPGQSGMRGALSYAIARAIEGAADRNRDGKTTRRELFEYTRQLVQQYSQHRQVLYTEPNQRTDLLDNVVFRTAGTPEIPPPTEAGLNIRLAVLSGTAPPLASIQPRAAKVEIVGAGQQPDLVWDMRKEEIVSGAGDVVARNVDARDVAFILDRTVAVAFINKISDNRPQRIVVRPEDRNHRRGENVEFFSPELSGKHVIVFNIANDGTIQFQYPDDRYNEESRLGKPEMSLQRTAAEPFGVDHVVIIVSDEELKDLKNSIKQISATQQNKQRAAGILPDLLRKLLPNAPTVRIGTAAAFTIR
jgi:hypothetical protein